MRRGRNEDEKNKEEEEGGEQNKKQKVWRMNEICQALISLKVSYIQCLQLEKREKCSEANKCTCTAAYSTTNICRIVTNNRNGSDKSVDCDLDKR
jgi:hypothetical protein